MKFKSLQFLQSIFNEVLILFLLVFVINNYINGVERTINADGVGYYDYLPSIFIHHDLVRYNTDAAKSPQLFNRIKTMDGYVDINGVRIDRYLVGTAILESPFFLSTYLTTGRTHTLEDGYQRPYQQAIYHAALFYLFLTIFLLKKLLQGYNLKRSTIIIVQLMLVLGTSVTNYVNFDAGYSHIYSLFAITAFIFFTKLFLDTKSRNNFFAACFMLGLVILIRPVNGVILFFIPFLSGSWQNFRNNISFLLKHYLMALIGILSIISVLFIQCLLWYLQTGAFIVNSYGDVGFDFLSPEWTNVLFSYRKGLFVYTPMLWFAVVALIWLLFKRRFFEVVAWFSVFLIATYFISSWKCWSYGCSFGLRAFVDYYVIFFILIAFFIDKLTLWLKLVLMVPALFFIYLNIVQTYQYKNYILPWDCTDKNDYWNIFLKTSENCQGVYFRKQYDFKQLALTSEIVFSDKIVPEESNTIIAKISSSRIKDFDKVNLLQFGCYNDFNEHNDAKISITVVKEKSDIVLVTDKRYFLLYTVLGFNRFQQGAYFYDIPEKKQNGDYDIIIEAHTKSHKLDLRNIHLRAFAPK